jgi:mercuric ion transport protein
MGAVITAFLASLCCLGPLVFVALGMGAGLATTFEPLRPVFVALTIGFLGLGYYGVYGPPKRASGAGMCAAGPSCAVPRSRKRDAILLWAATAVAVVLLSFPSWSKLLV